MSGIVTWVILGSLIFIIFIFMIVMGVIDKKKQKKFKKEQEVLEALKLKSPEYISTWVNEVIENNRKLLKEFVPSIGKLKMGDIKIRAHKSLVILKKKKEFIIGKEVKKSKKAYESFDQLLNCTSNTWEKKCKDALEYFSQYKIEEETEELKMFKESSQKEIGKVYELTK